MKKDFNETAKETIDRRAKAERDNQTKSKETWRLFRRTSVPAFCDASCGRRQPIQNTQVSKGLVNIHPYANTHTRKKIRTHTQEHTHTHIHTHTHTRTHTRTHTHTHAHTHTHTHAHTHTQEHTHAHARTHARTRKNTRTHTQEHTHAYTQQEETQSVSS
jgi:hypothetical protein